jgi:hypothetical protein
LPLACAPKAALSLVQSLLVEKRQAGELSPPSARQSCPLLPGACEHGEVSCGSRGMRAWLRLRPVAVCCAQRAAFALLALVSSHCARQCAQTRLFVLLCACMRFSSRRRERRRYSAKPRLSDLSSGSSVQVAPARAAAAFSSLGVPVSVAQSAIFPSHIQGSAEARGGRGDSRGKRSEDTEEAFAERTPCSRGRSDGGDVRAARERERVRAL